jgi:two-component system NtrC family sensor kinase
MTADSNPSERILVVDDSVAIVSLLANEILPLGGYHVTAAYSGEEGLEAMESADPDLILCDLEMPGISGLDMLRSVQEKRGDIPAIMMTAFGSEAVATQALRMGVKDYIVKPFTTDEILASIERALAERRLISKLEDSNRALREYHQALAVLQAVSQAASQGLEPTALLERIILAAVFAGKAQGGFIARLNPDVNLLDVQAVTNLPNWEAKQIDLEQDPGLSAALTVSELSRTTSKAGYWYHIPLLRQGTATGLMSVVSRFKQLPPSAESIFASLAGYAAFALENTRLRSELAVAMLQGKS